MDINQLLQGRSLNQLLGRLLPEQQLVREVLSNLRPGQELLAKVLAQPRQGLAQLLIQDVRLSAHTGRPLTPGQTLKLLVLKGGDTPQLQILNGPKAPTAQDILRFALPRQIPLREGLLGLRDIAPRLLPLLAGPAREALRNLTESGIPARGLSGERLQQAIRNSGLFSEARMAQGKPPDSGDRKVQLMRLIAALPARPAPAQAPAAASTANAAALSRAALAATAPSPLDPLTRAALAHAAAENARGAQAQAVGQAAQNADQSLMARLWRLLDGSLARIQTQQAASLPADDNTRPAWQLELPMLTHGGVLQTVDLRVEQEPPGSEEEEGEGGWLVTIGFNFAELGPVKAGVRLAEGRIYTTFWCEHPATARRFDAELPQLRSALESAGLEVAHLAASEGEPPPDSASTTPQESLLDERV